MAKPKKKAGAAGKGRGRPRKDLDLTLIARLAECGCSVDEIAAMLKRSGLAIDRRTILRRLQESAYRNAWEDGQLVLKANLRSKSVQIALGADEKSSAACQVLLHLLKTVVGLSERSAVDLTVKRTDLTKLTDEELEELERISRKIAAADGDTGGEEATRH